MRTLQQLLGDASQHGARELVLESGRKPQVRGSNGTVEIGVVLTDGDLYDALSAVLAPEQQAELAVGNVVEFQLDAGPGRWTLVTEARAEGIAVRGRVQAQAGGDTSDELGDPLELPALDPFGSSAEAERSTPTPGYRGDVLRQTMSDLPAAAAAAELRSAFASALEGGRPPTPPRANEAPSNGEGRGVAAKPIGLSSPHTPQAMFAFDDDEGFSIRTRADVEDDELEPARTRGSDERPTRREPTVGDAPSPMPRRGKGVDEPLRKYGRALAAGTLCVIRGDGHGDLVAEGIGESSVVIDARNLDRLAALAFEVPLGSTFVVRLEDPSICLGWILRRVEEGARVIVETRAQTAVGARRVLLGTHSGPHAATWLAAHTLCWLAQEDGAWAMVTT